MFISLIILFYVNDMLYCIFIVLHLCDMHRFGVRHTIFCVREMSYILIWCRRYAGYSILCVGDRLYASLRCMRYAVCTFYDLYEKHRMHQFGVGNMAAEV